MTDTTTAQDTSDHYSVPTPAPDSPVAGLDGFTHRYADVNGTRIHAVVGGSGPAVVLLHGWPFTWRVWRRVLPGLAANGHTVIAPDLRGTGDSGKPETGYAKTDVAEDVHLLARSLGFDQVDLVGMDIGAMVAFAYAITRPDRVRHLVLSESVLPGFGLEKVMDVAAGGLWHFGFHMQVAVAEMLTAGKEAAYLTPRLTGSSPGGGLTDADRTDFLSHYSAPGGMRGGFQHYATLIEDGKANRATLQATPGAGLTMPVLVLNGDQGIPQAMLLGGVKQVASDVDADTVPHSGHAYAADNPDWVVERLTRFFATSTPASTPEG